MGETNTKEAASLLAPLIVALTAGGSLATIAYSAAFLKDRAERQKWQKRIEEQLEGKGKKIKDISFPGNSPIIVMDEAFNKMSSLQGGDVMSSSRNALIKISAQQLKIVKQARAEQVAKGWKTLAKILGFGALVGAPLAYNKHQSDVNKAKELGGVMAYQRIMPWIMAMNAGQGNLSSPYSIQSMMPNTQFPPPSSFLG